MARYAGLPLRRRLAGALLAVVLLPGVTALLAQLRGSLTLPSDMLVMLLAVVMVALVGGWVPGLVAAITGSLLLNYYFTQPHYTLKIDDRNEALAIAVFTVVAAAVSSLVDLAATRTAQADRARQEAAVLAAADRTRAALLAAVSHDLRTPLAGAKAAVTSLRSRDVSWSDDEEAELLLTADESLDRLTRLVENLLDMSRIQAGAVAVSVEPVALEEVVPRALDGIGGRAHEVRLELPGTVPEVLADPALLERVVANLVTNALIYAPATPPLVAAAPVGADVHLRVVDHGPGVPASAYDRIFLPFQRLGDGAADSGVGLGLALARGLVEAMGGTLLPEVTPGGGMTMVVTLPAVASGAPSHRAGDLVP
jgi:two-component system, OmpR family, sensor histidine kinase KdpD